MTGPFHGTVGVKLGVIPDKLAYDARWSPCVNRIQTAPGSAFGPCAQNTVPQNTVGTVQWKWKYGFDVDGCMGRAGLCPGAL